MINGILCMTAVLFGLKIAWNIFTPIVLARRSLSASTDKPSGVSLVPLVEIVLMLLLILLSALSSGTAWFNHPMQVLLWGSVTIVGSHILCAILIFALGWLVPKLQKRKAK